MSVTNECLYAPYQYQHAGDGIGLKHCSSNSTVSFCLAFDVWIFGLLKRPKYHSSLTFATLSLLRSAVSMSSIVMRPALRARPAAANMIRDRGDRRHCRLDLVEHTCKQVEDREGRWWQGRSVMDRYEILTTSPPGEGEEKWRSRTRRGSRRSERLPFETSREAARRREGQSQELAFFAVKRGPPFSNCRLS